MSGGSKKIKSESKDVELTEEKKKTCFVIMPIADHPDYSPGHFMRVYDYIIKPACLKAGFRPERADDAQHTHFIMMNILQRILEADLAICDLSSKNPNVMYELGVRQAFDKPVALIKDNRTDRVFDTGMLSDVEYASDLRIDNVQEAVDTIALRLQNTYDKKDERVNSLIQLMRIQPAVAPQPTVVSSDTNVILDALATLGRRISAIEKPSTISTLAGSNTSDISRYCYMRFEGELDKVNEFVAMFEHLVNSELMVSCDTEALTSQDGTLVVEFAVTPPTFIPKSLIDKAARRVGITPSLVVSSKEEAISRTLLMTIMTDRTR